VRIIDLSFAQAAGEPPTARTRTSSWRSATHWKTKLSVPNVGYSEDMWSIGVILAWLATNGRHIFYVDSRTPEEEKYDKRQMAIDSVLATGVVQWLERNRSGDPDLNDLVDKCLQRAADDRITAAQALKHPFVTGAKP